MERGNEMIHIVLPIHNRKPITCRFIKQLKRQTYQDYQIILVDDGCTDGTRDAVLSIENRITVLNGDDLWWAGAMQRVYEYFYNSKIDRKSLIMIANDDAIFGDDFLEKSIKKFKIKTILMPKIFVDDMQIDGGARVEWNNFSLGLNNNPNCCSTRCIILALGDFIATGKWYPEILPHYLSDTEWTYRAHRGGVRIVEGENIQILREEDATKSTKIFSKKNPYNPIYYSSFILLACPFKYIPINLFKIWYRTVRGFSIKLLHKIVTVRIYPDKGKWYSKGAWLTLTMNTSCNLRCPDCPLWISAGRIAGILILEKRQREVAFAEMQRQEMERQKHMKAPILYRPG
jgi:glycosyltransferase involved in cell wall biosynthesis